MKKNWNIPKLVKLEVSKTATGSHPKLEYHNGSHDHTARLS